MVGLSTGPGMAHRNLYPSVSKFQCSFTRENRIVSECTRRTFQSSARRVDEQPSDAPSPAPAPQNRRARSVAALKQLTSLQNRRIIPRALARGSFPSGQTAQGNPRTKSGEQDESGFIPEDAESSPASATNTSQFSLARQRASPIMRGSAPPMGTMVRAPAQLRISRNAGGGGNKREGLNLRGRDQGRNRGPRDPAGSNKGNERGPNRRDKAKSSSAAAQHVPIDEMDPAVTLSDAMVLQLLRLQRKEWDRVPYEPKYAPGSFAANELIYAGRELFRGDSPRVKIWGPLEKRIGLVGMHGAEATLEIRRVGDGDAEPFGQEILEVEEMEKADSPENVKKEVVL